MRHQMYSLAEIRSLIEFGDSALPADYTSKQNIREKGCTITFSWPEKRVVTREGYAFARWATDAPVTLWQVCRQLEELLAEREPEAQP